MKKVVVMGCPRSGQRYLQSAFGQVKVLAGWEQDVGDSNITISYMLAADTDDYRGRHEPWWNRKPDEVWHNLRHPLRCIPSMAARLPGSVWSWQYHITGLHPRSETFPNRRMFAALFWAKWNEQAEQRNPDWQYRIEDLGNGVWEEMWERLGEDPKPLYPRGEGYRGSEREKGLEPPEPMTYDEIKSWSPSVCDEVRRMADRYGYSDED